MSWRAAVVPGGLALVLALLVVGLTLIHLRSGLGGFVTAGDRSVSPRPHLPVRPGVGYDGQFVYRLALAPLDLRTRAHGITLDTPLRAQRIGLPALAWLVSLGGRPTLVPGALVGIDVAALSAVGGLGGLLAAKAGRAPAWGLLLAGAPGLAFALQHDLTEVLEIALMLGGLVLLWSRKPAVAGVSLATAALTRETALLLAAAVLIERVVVRRRLGRYDLPWLLPVVAFIAWQLLVVGLTGSLPLRSDSGMNLAPPFVGLVHLIGNLSSQPSRPARLVIAELVLLAFLLLAALPLLRRAPRPLPLAWLLSLVFSLLLSTFVWEGYDDLRFLVDLTELTLLVLLVSRRRLADVAALVGAAWVFTLVLRVT